MFMPQYLDDVGCAEMWLNGSFSSCRRCRSHAAADPAEIDGSAVSLDEQHHTTYLCTPLYLSMDRLPRLSLDASK
jgi:hypothetical protein